MHVSAAAQVHIVGASGRSGAALARSLLGDGIPFTPVVRAPERWRATGLPGTPRIADLTDAAALRQALADATQVVSCAHARHAGAILDAAPSSAQFVFLGSTRKFTRWLDQHGRGVLQGEAAFLASGRPGVMLHPTMIYGAQGEDNVQRLAALLRRLPLVPLPEGGRALVQPIHQDDVTACLRGALDIRWQTAESLVVAGPEAVAYVDFVRKIAAAAGLRRPRIIPLPIGPLILAGRLSGMLPGLPRVGGDEIRRLTEDKAFDISPMIMTLGVRPISLETGLSRLVLRRTPASARRG